MPVYTWGFDYYGRLGNNTVDVDLASPSIVAALSMITPVQSTTGAAHNAVIDEGGEIYTWGKCHRGQLGHGEADTDLHVPTLVASLKGIFIHHVSAGDSHCLATSNMGLVYSW